MESPRSPTTLAMRSRREGVPVEHDCACSTSLQLRLLGTYQRLLLLPLYQRLLLLPLLPHRRRRPDAPSQRGQPPKWLSAASALARCLMPGEVGFLVSHPVPLRLSSCFHSPA